MKKLKILVGAVALFAVVVVNVWNAATTLRGSDLSLADVEAMANPEGMVGTGFSKGGEWITAGIDGLKYFSMSGYQVDYEYTCSGNSYIVTYYQNWDCAPRSALFQCNAGETRRYEMRATVWSGDNINSVPPEGNSPHNNNWNGYILPY